MLNRMVGRLVAGIVFLILILLVIQIASASLGIPPEYLLGGLLVIHLLLGAKNQLVLVFALIVIVIFLLSVVR